jgi:hypothetical protein
LTLTGVLSQSFSSISPVSSRCFSSMTFRLSDFVPLNDYKIFHKKANMMGHFRIQKLKY